MHGPLLATLAVAALLGPGRPSIAGPTGVVDEARRRLDRQDGASAVALLEGAIADSGPGREAVLGLLPRAYELAAAQADAAGRTRDAATYRENLKILNRRPRVAEPDPIPVASPSPASSPAPLPDGPTRSQDPEPAAPEPSGDPLGSTPEPAPAPARARDEPAELLPLPAPSPAPGPDLAAGDAAFAAKNYAEAGRIYALLAKTGKLPEARKEHWVYCRSAGVVGRINAHPQTEAEWAAITAEIDRIRALDPNNWLGEYLRNLAADRPGARKSARAGRPVVRASSPEEPPPVDRPVRPASNARPAPSPAATPPAPKAPAAAGRVGTAVGRWQIRDTANFRIYHADPALADKVAEAAEAVRREQTKRWTNVLPRAAWQPQCEIYLYPTAKQYAQMTGQPEDSPGFSTMGMNAGRITARRVNLRADHPALIDAVLPHEVTHVILADVFPTQQIPRWADEGLAVLSEPAQEQARRAADLSEPLAANRLFPIEALMSMDYPDNRYWSLYYAQSVSLSRFLVEQGTPAQMIQFLQGSQKNGFEVELRRVYKIDGYADLQARWHAYAKAKEPARTASATPADVAPDLKVR